jgi:hypothetical protein
MDGNVPSGSGPTARADAEERQWAVALRVLGAARPELSTAPPRDSDTSRTVRRWIVRTVGEVDTFAADIETVLSSQAASTPGSAYAILSSMVMVCRAFTRKWTSPGTLPARAEEFNRDVERLRTLLDGVAADS